MNWAKKWVFLILFTLLVLLIALGYKTSSRIDAQAPEIEAIKALAGINDQSAELIKLLERVGPIEAQEEMLRSGLPFTGETHLLVHTIGDYIYDKHGPEGLSLCRDYFLSACYHGFIINTLGDHGMEGMVEAMENCENAGPGILPQCAHAAGHGFVAWHDYDLLKGARMCDELGDKTENFPHYNCYDGVFMENIWGVHNGAPSEKRWVNPDDIYYPCTDKRIPEKYLKGCWSNQATLIYQYLKGDLVKTAEACDKVMNEEYRDICYNNLARQIHPLTEGKAEKAIALCATAPSKERQDDCLLINTTAAWSVGDRTMPYELCFKSAEPLKDRCYNGLIGMINYYYLSSPQEKKFYCDKIADATYKDQCNG